MRPSIRDPTPVSPTASKSPSERKYDVQPNARCRAAYLSARAICAGVNKASGATGTRRPPGTQSHGTSHAARATTATALTIRVVSAAPRARPCREVVVTAPSLSRSTSEIAKVGLPRAGEPLLVGVQHPCERESRRGEPIREAVEPDQPLLAVGLSQQSAGEPGGLVGSPQGLVPRVELPVDGKVRRRALPSHLG